MVAETAPLLVLLSLIERIPLPPSLQRSGHLEQLCLCGAGVMDTRQRERKLAAIVATLPLPPHVTLRAWDEVDFPAVQRLSAAEGWTTPVERPQEALVAWQHSWPAWVALHEETVIGFSRAVSDGMVTTYIAELLVSAGWRRQGMASALLQTTYRLCPGSRLDLLATSDSRSFYERLAFRPFAGFRWSWQEESARAR